MQPTKLRSWTLALPVTEITPAGPIELNRSTSELLLNVGTKLRTTKVQLGAYSAEGAVSAESQNCSFPKKSEIPVKTANNVSLRSHPFGTSPKFKHYRNLVVARSLKEGGV